LAELWRLQLTEEERTWGHYLLVRRSISDPKEQAYYVVFARRAEVSLERLVKVAGRRWQIEQAFEAAKSECGLDEYEVRRLLCRLVWSRPTVQDHVLAWSTWRRRHQQRARASHYRRRTSIDTS